VLTNKDKYKKDLTEKINTTNTGNDIKELQNSVKEIKHEINELKFCIKQFIEMLTMQSYEEDDA
jgi:predicted RNase H-like nuclease (RuvC/YqgF family)